MFSEIKIVSIRHGVWNVISTFLYPCKHKIFSFLNSYNLVGIEIKSNMNYMMPDNAIFNSKLTESLNNTSFGIRRMKRWYLVLSNTIEIVWALLFLRTGKRYKIMVVTSQKHHVLQSIFRCWLIFSPYSISYQLNPYVNIYTL